VKEIVQLKVNHNLDFLMEVDPPTLWIDVGCTLTTLAELRALYPEETYRIVILQKETK
jgi:hypothetical protein